MPDTQGWVARGRDCWMTVVWWKFLESLFIVFHGSVWIRIEIPDPE